MKKIILLVFLSLIALDPLNLSNSYLRCDTFETVTVHPGDTLHKIADKYTVNESDKDELIEAICEINDVHSDSGLRVGRPLQIPVMAHATGNEIARK